MRFPGKKSRGVTLLEVLISIGITSIGLLGVLSLIPLAGAQARKGQVSERAAVIGNAAISELRTRGGMNPQRWSKRDGSAPIDLARQLPRAFCIDPITVAADTTNAYGAFPVLAAAQAKMERITLRNPLNNQPLDGLFANMIFQSQDDLSLGEQTRDANGVVDRTLAPYQLWAPLDSAANKTATPVRRQFDGNMSWMATIVPRWDGVEPSESTQPFNFQQNEVPPRYRDLYHVSIVVFNRRVPGEEVTSEVIPTTDFTGGGIAGGDVKITFSNANDARIPTPEDSWLLLSGSVQAGNVLLPVFGWYRVVASDPDAINPLQRYFTLDGPDWNTSATNMRATIIDGTVGVYGKTMRLETSSLWNN